MSTFPMATSGGPAELARDSFAPGLLGLAERGLVPDSLLRFGIRQMCAERLKEERRGGPAAEAARFRATPRATADSRMLLLRTDAANNQHYELPPVVFRTLP